MDWLSRIFGRANLEAYNTKDYDVVVPLGVVNDPKSDEVLAFVGKGDAVGIVEIGSKYDGTNKLPMEDFALPERRRNDLQKFLNAKKSLPLDSQPSLVDAKNDYFNSLSKGEVEKGEALKNLEQHKRYKTLSLAKQIYSNKFLNVVKRSDALDPEQKEKVLANFQKFVEDFIDNDLENTDAAGHLIKESDKNLGLLTPD